MRHEPIEIGPAGTTMKTRASDTRRMTTNSRGAETSIKTKCGTQVVEVVDEAFAGFTPDRRRALQPALVANLSAQLEALDQQREQLSQLLHSIDLSSMSQ
jgi:hypothetical protein